MRAEQQEFLKKKVEKGTEIGIRDRPVVPQLPPSDQLSTSPHRREGVRIILLDAFQPFQKINQTSSECMGTCLNFPRTSANGYLNYK